jgi:hypothetical protein
VRLIVRTDDSVSENPNVQYTGWLRTERIQAVV